MGITAIKRIENRSRSTIQVLNRENPNSRGSNRVVGSGSSIAADIWIPWAPRAEDFMVHHLEIQQFGRTRYWMWQAANADGDFIRFSTDGLWHDQGEKVHGYPGVAKNIFEAVGSAVLSGQLQPLGDLLLGERTLVVLDSHFETIPIAPKPLQVPFTNIKRIENWSSKSVVLFNKEKNTTSTSVAPSGGTADVNMTIPWAGQATDFPGHRLELRMDGQTRYWIWQAESEADGDYIRFATTESWSATATRVNGIPGTGITPADLVFTGDRTLIVRDSGVELWPYPLLIDGLLGTVKSLLPAARRVSETALTPAPPSVPKKSPVAAFSIAGQASDAFKRGQRGARFLYNDTGKRYEFTINAAGTIVVKDPDGNSTPLTAGWSNTDSRLGKSVTPPPFDLVAASGGRVFAKAKDKNDFYIATMDHMFIHAPKEAAADAVEIVIPSTSFKLDPQFGTGANSSELLASTDNVPTDCPMSERFPLFRRLMQSELLDLMIVRMEPGVLHQIDVRPPQNVIGLAMRNAALTLGPAVASLIFNQLGFGLLVVLAPFILFEILKNAIGEALRSNVEMGSAPPAGVPTYRPVTYALPDGTTVSPPAIKYERVLDIGVSHAHWFQQYELEGGGELQPMLLSEFLQSVYRFFNGPVQDGDGFIDGTCNVYALVKHEPTLLRPHGYALLFLDEQWYFNQRWRMVDPEDNAGLTGTITSDLGNPSYQWNPATYWCPFRNGHINERSRLAVACHVILVTGNDPVTNVPRIYSINFSWATIDRTWRYRQLPPGEVTYFDQAMLEAGNETIRTDIERVYPQTIRLREDMTIHLKGAGNVNGTTVAGRWYQRYLPVDNAHVPAKEELQPGAMPVRGYTHRWKFLPESVFQLADSFSHFGVYDTVDSRCQYYDVTPASATDAATLDAGGPGPWIDDTRQLYVSQWKFRYDAQRPGADPIDPPSLFNADTRLRIVRRGARWIAMHWDKRDDDLVAFERLPMTVTLKNGTRTVRVAIGPHHRVLHQPMVRNAWIWLEPDGTAGVAFLPVGSASTVRDNVWRVRIAAVEPFEDPATHITRPRVVPLVDVTTEGAFTPVAFGRYERRWTPTAAELASLRRYCSPEGAAAFATSIWFEDVVGDVSVPESITWQRSHSVSAFATPNSVFLDRPVELTVIARDSRTQQVLDGEVRVNDVVVARTGQKFTHTFKMTLPRRTIISVDDKEPIEPLEPIPPVVTVTVRDYPPAYVDIEFVPYFSGAAFVRQSVPASMISGSTYQASVTMRNNGTSTWTNGATNPFRLGSQSPQDNSTWGFGRRELPAPVAPGAEVTFNFDVIAPPPGAYSFQWRMLQEMVEWFGDLTPVVPVQVLGRTMSVSMTPYPAPLSKTVSVIVRAVDSQTGAPVAGKVRIDNITVADTNTPFNYTFRRRQITIEGEIEIRYPFGMVTAPGYESAPIDFGFPEF